MTLPVYKVHYLDDGIHKDISLHVELVRSEAAALKRAKEMSNEWPGYTAVTEYPTGREIFFLHNRRIRKLK